MEDFKFPKFREKHKKGTRENVSKEVELVLVYSVKSGDRNADNVNTTRDVYISEDMKGLVRVQKDV